MANSRLIKRRIVAAKNISKITKAMEMVAASKMRRAQDQATTARPYAQALYESLQKLSQDINPSLHELLQIHDSGAPLLIIFSTDKGLCGSLNNQLFKNAWNWNKNNPNGKFIAIGRKAVHFCKLAGLEIYAQFTDLPEKITTSDILPISSLIIDDFKSYKLKSVTILYMDFINTLSQKPKITQILPIEPDESYQDPTMTKVATSSEYTFEPSAAKILSELLPYFIENTLFQAFLEARASEHSARMVTMKNASENAGELVDELQLEFNKTRQAAITTELLDITTASLTIN